jgi:hypothetical protein
MVRYRNPGTQVFDDTEHESVSTEDQTITRSQTQDRSRYNPHVSRGMGQSSTPLYRSHPLASNPVLTGDDVTDATNPTGVADPFILPANGQYHLFFEILSDSNHIGHATSVDGLQYSYDQIVIDFNDYNFNNLAHPFFFQLDGTWYMIPDTSDAVRLFEATNFPTDWEFVETLFSETHTTADPIPIYFDDRWYIVTTDRSGNGEIYLYVADNDGEQIRNRTWSEHPNSPIATTGGNTDQASGRPIVHDEYVDLFFQDASVSTAVSCFRVHTLTPTSFGMSEVATSPVLTGVRGVRGWDGIVHHIDPVMDGPAGGDIAIYDGQASDGWEIGVATTAHTRPHHFAAELTSQQTVSSGAVTKIDFGRAKVDTGLNFDESAVVWTPPASGYYQFKLRIQWDGQTSTEIPFECLGQIYDSTNSTGLVSHRDSINNANNGAGIEFSGVAWVEAGTNVIARTLQRSGTDLTLTSGRLGTELEITHLY